MNSFVLTAQAEEDSWHIWQYLAKNGGKRVADRIKADFVTAFGMLAEMPGIGHIRDDLTDRDIFFFLVQSYLIVYRKTVPLDILAIIHASRDVAQVLDERVL